MSLDPHEAVAELELASKVAIGACSCSVHIQLQRETGEIFAAAALGADLAERIGHALLKAAEILKDPNASRETH